MAEATGLEPYSVPPARRVVFVHGTWGHGFWRALFWNFIPCEKRQKDCDWLIRKTLEEKSGAKIYSFTWSGRNSHRARMEAGRDLANLLLSLPPQPTSIVAHSHGGNVALYALKNVGTDRIDSIVLLATPFLHVSTQNLDLRIFRWVPLLIGYIAAVIAAVFLVRFDRLLAVVSVVGISGYSVGIIMVLVG